MRRICAQLGAGSYLAFLLWSLLLVALLPNDRLWTLLIVILAFGWLTGGAGWRALTRRFWVFMLPTVALAPLILGEPDVHWGGLSLSRSGLETGLWMAVRALTLTLAFGVSLEALSVVQMMRLFDALRLRGFGFALGVAMNLAPVLRATIEAAYHTLRLRGGFRRPVRSLRLFLITVIANALRYGDDVVKAASARAFDPSAAPSRASRVLGRADAAFIAGLVAIGMGLLLESHWG